MMNECAQFARNVGGNVVRISVTDMGGGRDRCISLCPPGETVRIMHLNTKCVT